MHIYVYGSTLSTHRRLICLKLIGMFEKLRNGLTVPESLQASMVHMIDNGRSMYEWAPLFAMGSPKLRLPKYSSKSPKFEFTCTITPDPTEVSELSLVS